MTYRELLQIIHPEEVDDKYVGGCKACPGASIPGALSYNKGCHRATEYGCRACWDQEATPRQIRKVLDKKYIEKRAKWVSGYIGEDVASFYPVVRCSACGKSNGFMVTPYCPYCGSKMANPIGPKEDSNE